MEEISRYKHSFMFVYLFVSTSSGSQSMLISVQQIIKGHNVQNISPTPYLSQKCRPGNAISQSAAS